MCRFRTGAVAFGSRLALLLFFTLTIAISSSLAPKSPKATIASTCSPSSSPRTARSAGAFAWMSASTAMRTVRTVLIPSPE